MADLTAGAAPGGDRDARAAARLLAVQALYQMDIAKTPLENIIREFVAHRLDVSMDGVNMPDSDAAYFENILRGVVENQTPIDRRIDECLSENWHLARLDSTLRAILRCGVYELAFGGDAPTGVLVSQYTDIAHAFFDGPEGGMANALLDRVGQAVASNAPPPE
jgi:N utilization substance protein B